jgi:hypothetical protein
MTTPNGAACWETDGVELSLTQCLETHTATGAIKALARRGLPLAFDTFSVIVT